jgi:hypothetical protein
MAKQFKKPDITGNLFGQDKPVVPLKPTPLAKLPKPAPPPKADRFLTAGEKALHKRLFGTTPYASKKLSEFKKQIAEYRNRGNTRGL